MPGQSQYCTFLVGGLFLGVPVLTVQEVMRFLEMTRLPLAPPPVRGLLNLRGQIVTALDLRERLGLGQRPPECLPMNVVVRTGGEAVSLLVDEIGDVLEVDELLFEPPPGTLQGTVRDLLRGVYKLPGRLLLALDVERAVNLDGTLERDETVRIERTQAG